MSQFTQQDVHLCFLPTPFYLNPHGVALLVAKTSAGEQQAEMCFYPDVLPTDNWELHVVISRRVLTGQAGVQHRSLWAAGEQHTLSRGEAHTSIYSGTAVLQAREIVSVQHFKGRRMVPQSWIPHSQ